MIDKGDVTVIGIVQEQHAERTRLYKQWRQLKWPIVQDALNLTRVKVVPLFIAIDGAGGVVSHNANVEFIERWIAGEVASDRPDDLVQSESPLAEARQAFLWSEKDPVGTAIEQYEVLTNGSEIENPSAHFELAVCYRTRYDQLHNAEDFQKAIDHWSTALSLSPNQYIYRRRIEQYGARLGKPYPFYDWVATAQKEIAERGEVPLELMTPLTGAEIAKPSREFVTEEETKIDWDGANAIQPDDEGLFDVKTVSVPAIVKPGTATRVHVHVTPGGNAKWNNETESTMFLIENCEGVSISQNRFEYELPKELQESSESNESRHFEFEVKLENGVAEPVTIRGCLLTNVCITDSGVCTYLRKPFELTITPKN